MTSGQSFPTPQWPFANLSLVEEVFSTGFLLALLGYFESSVVAKSLRLEGDGKPSWMPEDAGQQYNSPSPNRELVALGVANLVGGHFSTLDGFGGFGRSKLNVQTGGVSLLENVTST